MLRRWFERVVLSRGWLCFIVLGLAFFVFGACTLNLFFLFRANATLVLDHGWQALMDGAAEQLVELLATGYAGMASYVVFKACEHRLVQALAEHTHDEDRSPPR